tara:strand:- start:718 stop:1044 length:327 start_codon:yes stop_codon:yes gene_type:complete
MIIYPFRKNKFIYILFIYLVIPFTSLKAFESKDYLVIDRLVKRCYKDLETCNSALFKIHNYQKNAAANKKFSCQTRLLGLEANLIMVMNFNSREREAQSIIQAVKKHC